MYDVETRQVDKNGLADVFAPIACGAANGGCGFGRN